MPRPEVLERIKAAEEEAEEIVAEAEQDRDDRIAEARERADEIRAPLMVLHGANDPRVPVGEAEQIVEKASEHVPVEKLIFEDEGHGFAKRENRIEAYAGIAEFLAEHV